MMAAKKSAKKTTKKSAKKTTKKASKKATKKPAKKKSTKKTANKVAKKKTTRKTPAKKQRLGEKKSLEQVQAERVSQDERARWIAEAAYFRAESRGFVPGAELEDWLAAEAAFRS
jgi:hypothetical protein